MDEGTLYNDEILITESGDFTVPYTGDFEVTVIGGGGGAYLFSTGISAGNSGIRKQKIKHFNRNDIISVVIGSGGNGVDDYMNPYSSAQAASRIGGATSFAGITAEGGNAQLGAVSEENLLLFTGDNLNKVNDTGTLSGDCSLSTRSYGGGGSAGKSTDNHYANSGRNGCVILRGHNPNKS